MAIANVNPTRMELTRLKKRLKTARRGHKLLKDKRDELMKQFLDVVKENKRLRLQVEEGVTRMYGSFIVASAKLGDAAVSEALMAPKTYGVLSVGRKNVMSVNVPLFSYEIKAATKSGEGGDDKQLPTELSDLGIDLTKKARENKLDPIIGRKEEIERIIQILCRKTKNNPVLIGEPGVGKVRL